VNAIETYNLSKTYDTFFFWKGRPALDRLTMAVPEGRIFGFLGPNGAGKTTTLKLLLGLLHPSAGGGRLLGEDMGSSKAKERLGYLSEKPTYYGYLKASEFLNYYAKIFHIRRGERKKRIDELLDRVGLVEHHSSKLKTFSHGMLQRVGLAQAMLNDPDLLLLDEPIVGLDPLGRKQFKNIIKRASREEGKTIFFCSHILADVEEICDMVGILCRGHLLIMDEVHNLPFGQKTVLTLSDPPGAALAAIRQDGIDIDDREDTTVVTVGAGLDPDEIEQTLLSEGAECIDKKVDRETLEEYFVRIVQESERR
jgi:ABC-2 type transport system ATP-binding protein